MTTLDPNDDAHVVAEKTKSSKIHPPELGGGAGFTFEDAVAASYLVSLLAEGHAAGVVNNTVSRVALQQKGFGEPLDDIIVDCKDVAGNSIRLSLQVKRALTISDTKTNTDFYDVIRDSWLTLQKGTFRKGFDRYGTAVGEIAKDKLRNLKALCELARASVSPSLILYLIILIRNLMK